MRLAEFYKSNNNFITKEEKALLRFFEDLDKLNEELKISIPDSPLLTLPISELLKNRQFPRFLYR